ncbi:MAG: histidine kinase dimerization/phospho-acceptor domain-containing protein, partial [Chloroflexota bacterium]
MKPRDAGGGASRRRSERVRQSIEDARVYAQGIVETVREPLLVLTGDLQVRSANRSFYRTFHTTQAQTEGQSLYDLGNGQWDIPELHRLLEQVLTKDTSFNDFEVTHNFPGIGPKAMLLNARRLLLEGGRQQLILLAIEDVTERKRAAEFREDYLSLISHDLRNPLTVILGMAQWLQRQLGEAAMAQEASTAERIVTSAQRMNAMIQDLLESARLEVGRIELRREPTSLLQL